MQLGIRLHDVNAAAPETLQTLENTSNENAVSSRMYIQNLYDSL